MPADEEKLREADERLARGELAAAERLLGEVADSLKLGAQEMRLTERPRGLVGYVPKGEEGEPPSREEDALWNRFALVSRLVDVRRSDGVTVDDLRSTLTEAESALRGGDRERASALINRVHGEVERRLPPRRET